MLPFSTVGEVELIEKTRRVNKFTNLISLWFIGIYIF